MIQAKFSLEENHVNFLNLFKKYGFKDKSAVIRTALERLEKELEMEKLKSSAEMYASLYESDRELQDLTNSAITEWPE
ncbi:MAG: hypothetical protein DKINENOH_05226 [bacterium]|nr:hypothetical protein [bacterium]MCK6560160.1 hypothetical protein [bacterium]NUM68482.1 hypothetical protein [candidate division KSB1 bacterium]